MKIIINTGQYGRWLSSDMKKQMAFATMMTTNKVAFDVIKDFRAIIPRRVNINRPFLQSMLVVDKATKSSTSATVGFDSRARDIPNLLEEGGTRKPQGRTIAIPTKYSRSRTKPGPKSKRPSAQIGKGAFFMRTSSGTGLFKWPRTRRVF